jgi:vacuolar-type H+-ATPase subunit F/Vma7
MICLVPVCPVLEAAASNGDCTGQMLLMKTISFITPPDASYGFSLSGVPQQTVKTGDAEAALKMTMTETDTGLIIIDERLLQGMPEERLRELEQGWKGILLVLPSPVRPPAEVEDYAARLIRRAIGYHVRVKI